MSSLIQMNKMIKTPIYFAVISECPLGWHFSLPLLDWGKMLNVKCYSISWTSSNSCEVSLDFSDSFMNDPHCILQQAFYLPDFWLHAFSCHIRTISGYLSFRVLWIIGFCWHSPATFLWQCFMHLALVQLSAIDDQYVTIKYPSGIHSHIWNLMSSCSVQQTNLMSLSLLWIHVMHQCHQPENRNKNICCKKASKYQFWCWIASKSGYE